MPRVLAAVLVILAGGVAPAVAYAQDLAPERLEPSETPPGAPDAAPEPETLGVPAAPPGEPSTPAAPGEPSTPAAPGEPSTPAAPEAATEAPPVPPPPPPAERVAVLLVPTGDVDPATTDSLTELLISAVAARGVTQIVGKEELGALLGRDDAGILSCVESGVCLGQISVELGVREVVAGTLGVRDGRWVFALARIDARSGETSGRVFREVEGDLTALVGSLAGAVPELYVEAVRPGRLVIAVLDARTGAHVAGAEILLDDEPAGVTTDATFRRELVAPGAHTLEVRSPRHRALRRDIEVEEGATLVLDATLAPVDRGLELSPLTWVAGGLGLALLGGAIGLGVASQELPSPAATMRETFAHFDAREREAIGASVLYAVGGAALGLATVSLVLDVSAGAGDDEPDGDALRVELGGSGLVLRGTFR